MNLNTPRMAEQLPMPSVAPAPRTSRPRWHRLYYLLAAFDLVTVVLSLVLNHQTRGIFARSVDVNQDLGKRLTDYAELAQLAQAVNAPGNDVFDTLDVAGESAKMHTALRAFEEKETKLRGKIRAREPQFRQTIFNDFEQDFDRLEGAMKEMTDEAKLIFSYFAGGRPVEAGRRMATMDRKYANVNFALADMRNDVAAIQRENFAQQDAVAASLANFEYLIAGGIVLMICAAMTYGHKMAKRVEADARERERYVEELKAAHAELEVLYQRTKELDELKTQFFANVSHELRTPLALILGPVAQLRSSHVLGEAQSQQLEVVERNGRVLLKQINDLLDLSKLEAGKMDVAYAELDLARLVRRAAGDFDGLARERGITFEVDTPASAPAQADPAKLERVLLNLLANAFKFTPDGGTIRCVLRAEAEEAVLAVRDSGPGVPPALRDAIFERFRQCDGSDTRRHGGTGLGLSIAKDFVELHGGTVAVGDALEGGAAFTVSLPLRAPAGVELRPPAADTVATCDSAARPVLNELRPQPEAAKLPAGAAEGVDERPLVLVVEDNREMNRFIAETVPSECRVAAAFDGRDGLAKAVALRPDAIVADIMMPEMSGEQLLRTVRAREELAGVPFLVLSARADDEARARLLEAGAQDYLVKPFSVAELRARLGNQLATKRARDMLQQQLASQSQDVAALAAEVASRNRELSAANKDLRAAYAESERLKEEFFANLSHDLRTPVAAIKASIGVVLANEPPGIPEPLHRMLTNIDLAADRMGRLVSDLLELTRLKAGRVQPELGRTDLGALALRSGRAVDALLQTRGQRLEVQVPAEPVWAWADAERLERALLNLLSNAHKYGRAGGTVRLSVEPRPSEVVVAVTDDGPGIPEAEQKRIFGRYYRPRTEVTERTQGSGLGLAIAHAMVELQGGRIWVESNPGYGTTFGIALPLGAPPTAQQDRVGARALALAANGPRTSS